jgi:hypothetical protein
MTRKTDLGQMETGDDSGRQMITKTPNIFVRFILDGFWETTVSPEYSSFSP